MSSATSAYAQTTLPCYFASFIGLVLLCTQVGIAESTEPDFEKAIAPLIAGRCLECHNSRDVKGGLNLTTRAGLLKGGDSGPAISSQKPAESILLERLLAGEMPPKSRGQSQKLPDQEIAILRDWIVAGANWPAGRTLNRDEKSSHLRAGRDWWSLQPIRRPVVPKVGSKLWVANEIDNFVLAKLEANQLRPARPADKRTLIRRAYFDLLGIPASPDQVDRFVADRRPDAWERLIDELLASPHYGERWARYWLDVVRFAETCGYERDQLKPNIWRYRDWVINAFNNNMPYDQFVTQQLAGDEIRDRDESSVIATGMLRAGTWNDEPNDPADYVYERLEDMVHVTSSAFLGMTVKCARCHDHKFDPIRQTDYYRLAGFFWPGYIGQANLGGPNKEQLGFDVFGWTDKGRTAEPLRLLVNGERHHPGQIVEPGFLSAVLQLDHPLSPPPESSPTTQRRLQLARWITDPRNPLTARVIVNRLWLHHFGAGIVRTPNNFGFKGEQPTHPGLLDWLAAELVTPTIVSSKHARPSKQQPWTLKRIHKLIMMSHTYRQASTHPRVHDYLLKDSQNRLRWRFHRRRLDAESLRDAMLSVSGQLNKQMGGPSFFPRMSSEALEGLSRKGEEWTESDELQRRRRSVYLMTKRSRILPLMTAFDFCDTTRPCGQRDVTIVPTQALALLNNQFVHQQSQALARRLRGELAGDLARQIELAWRLTFGRPAKSDEVDAAVQHVRFQTVHFENQGNGASMETSRAGPAELALASLCHVLLNANEFVYVD